MALKPCDIAPIASNRLDSVQSSSSQPPANITSCLPHWIISVALPMQCADVAQAAAGDRVLPEFDIDVVDQAGALVARVHKTLHVRLKPHHRPS